MKVRFIGTGSGGEKDRAVTSFIINNNILFDVGGGVNRRLQELNIPDGSIKTLIVSHFHGDHISDLWLWLLRRKVRTGDAEKITIITPTGGRRRIIDYMQLLSAGIVDKYENIEEINNLEIIELSNDSVHVGEAKISAYDAKHGSNPSIKCNGYTIDIEGTVVGFSGDSEECPGLDTIVETSSSVMLDAIKLGEPNQNGHLGATGAMEYAKQYPNKKVYLIHRTDYEIEDLPKNVYMPNDGEEVEI